MSEEVKATPSSKWKENGEVDPHGNSYNCERSKLCMGNLTDDELANAAFMNYDVVPKLEEVLANTAKMPIVYMTAVKDRIRWLSRALEKEIAKNNLMSEEIKSMDAIKEHFSKFPQHLNTNFGKMVKDYLIKLETEKEIRDGEPHH